MPICTTCPENGEQPVEAFRKRSRSDRLRSACRPCEAKAERERYHRTVLPAEPVPEGFKARQVSSQIGEDGLTDKQWIEARRESESYAPHIPAIPTGHRVTGVSTLVGPDGQVLAQWQKTNQDAIDKRAALLEALASIAHNWQGVYEPTPAPPVDTDRLLTLYPMGDPHIGMFSWETETGSSFDLKIAERNACEAIDRLVEASPASAKALLVNIGDFFHSDSRKNQTTAGTPVDVDGRFAKVLSVGVRIMRYHIDRILTKHAECDVRTLGGNHDADTAAMLAICLAQFYEREPRVRVDTSPAKFQKYRFGSNLFGFTHQDTVKITALGEIMACDWPEDWAACPHRYWFTGHIHHKTVTELRGNVICESLRTLASSDAWHRGQGYRSGRDMQAIVYDLELGEKYRNRIGIMEIERGGAVRVA